MIKKIGSLDNNDVRFKSAIIKKTLLELLEFNKVAQSKKIGLYFQRGNEVRTKEIIEEFLELKKKIFLPRIVENKIVMKQIESLKDLEKGSFGLIEPKNKCTEIDPNDLEVIIIPCVSFDKDGNRLGSGNGYYDRFLSRCKTTKIILAYDFQISKKIPSEEHDIKADWIITEKRLIKLK